MKYFSLLSLLGLLSLTSCFDKIKGRQDLDKIPPLLLSSRLGPELSAFKDQVQSFNFEKKAEELEISEEKQLTEHLLKVNKLFNKALKQDNLDNAQRDYLEAKAIFDYVLKNY